MGTESTARCNPTARAWVTSSWLTEKRPCHTTPGQQGAKACAVSFQGTKRFESARVIQIKGHRRGASSV
jgi:hypothetical protein